MSVETIPEPAGLANNPESSSKVGRPRKCAQSIERVTLSEETVRRLDAWSRQVRRARPGVEISRRELVNWLILSHSDALSAIEERELSEQYYDELRFIQYALKELKAAKLRGESVTLQGLMGGAASLHEIAGSLAPRKRRQRRGSVSVGAPTAGVNGMVNPVDDTIESEHQESRLE